MRLRYDDATEAFRTELAGWLEANRPTLDEMRADPLESSAHLTPWAARWQRSLFDAGLLVPGWPAELGGRNLSPVQQLVYHEEMAKLPVQRTANPQGLDIIALDEAVEELQEVDERWFDVVLLRFFGGFSIKQTAELLSVSPRTVTMDWNQARAWLRVRLGDPYGTIEGPDAPDEGDLRHGEPARGS